MKQKEIEKFVDILGSSVPMERIAFQCKRCGECCKYRGDIFLTPLDVYYICNYLKISLETFLNSYVTLTDIKLYIKTKGDTEKTCIFYTDNGCLIHDVKPHACYVFPFIEFEDSYLVNLVPCSIASLLFPSSEPRPIKAILRSNSFRYEIEKDILTRYLHIVVGVSDALEKYHNNHKVSSELTEFFFKTLFSDIKLEMEKDEFFKWFEEQIGKVEDALIFI